MSQPARLITVTVALLATTVCAPADDFTFDVDMTARGDCDSSIATLTVDRARLQELVGVELKPKRWRAAVAHVSGAWLETQTTVARDEAGALTSCEIAWVMPGKYSDGDTDLCHIVLGADEEAGEADERVVVKRRGSEIIVRTDHIVGVHDTAAGGMLSTITCLSRPAVIVPMVMNDRVWSEGRGGYYLRNDPTPQVEIVSPGPLVAIIRTRARYCDSNGNPAPGEPSAIYTFRYDGLSPVVRMTAEVSAGDAQSWDQLHVFEMYHKPETPIFEQVAWGPPPESVDFVDEHNTHSLRGKKWGALMTGRNALALVGGQLYGIHTHLSGHGIYIHGPWTKLRNGTHSYESTLYFGPSGGDAEALAGHIAEAGSHWEAACKVPAMLRPADELDGRFAQFEATAANADFAVRSEALRLLEVGRWLTSGAKHASGRLDFSDWRASLDAAGSVAANLSKVLDGVAGPLGSPIIVSGESTCVIASDRTALRFSRDDESMGLTQIGDLFENANHLLPGATRPDLWAVTMREVATGELHQVTPGDAASLDWRTIADPGDEALVMTWGGCRVGETAEALDVTVRVSASSGLSRWGLSLRNHTTRYALWQTDFPRIGPVGPGGQVCVPRKWGTVLDTPLAGSGYRGSYPSGSAFAQLMCWWRGGAGLYYAAHDPEAGVKTLIAQASGGGGTVFSIVNFPPDMGVPMTERDLGFDVVVGAYDGDWFEAAKMYRDWATRQFWCRRGPIAEREDMPHWWKDCALCIRPTGDPEWVTQMGTNLQAAFDMPAVMHWYKWHQIPFDNDYPEYFPVVDGFGDAVKDLQAVGVHVMPYINGHIWDTDTVSWRDEDGRSGACLNENGDLYIEHWQKQEHAAMCPASEKWRSKMVEVCETLVRDYGVKGIYLDQIGAAGPRLCFATNHGHAVGGGGFWSRGYDGLLDEVRETVHVLDPEVILTTESNAEPYMAQLDGHLMCNQVGANQVPLYSAIYGGYTQSFGRAGEVGNPTAFYMEHGQAFAFGSMMGRINSEDLLKPENAEMLAYLKSLAQLRRDYADFMALGEMLRPPTLAGDIPTVATQWKSKTKDHVEMSAIQRSAWRAPDGRVGLFFTNVADDPVTFAHSFEPAAYGLSSAGKLRLQERSSTGRTNDMSAGADEVSLEYTLAPRETLAIVVSVK